MYLTDPADAQVAAPGGVATCNRTTLPDAAGPPSRAPSSCTSFSGVPPWRRGFNPWWLQWGAVRDSGRRALRARAGDCPEARLASANVAPCTSRAGDVRGGEGACLVSGGGGPQKRPMCAGPSSLFENFSGRAAAHIPSVTPRAVRLASRWIFLMLHEYFKTGLR